MILTSCHAKCLQLRSVEETTQAMAFDGIILEVMKEFLLLCRVFCNSIEYVLLYSSY